MKQQQGFTLVEIAIVLVIIGLLIGGLLKGQELIASAKVRNTISQMEELKTAVLPFRIASRRCPGIWPTPMRWWVRLRSTAPGPVAMA